MMLNKSSKKKPIAHHEISSQFSRVSVSNAHTADTPISTKAKLVNSNDTLKKSDENKIQPVVPAKPNGGDAQKMSDEIKSQPVAPTKVSSDDVLKKSDDGKTQPVLPTKSNEAQKKSDDTKPQPAPTKSLFSRISGMVGGIGTSSSKTQLVKEDKLAKPTQQQEEIHPSSIEEYTPGNIDDEFFGDNQTSASPFEGNSGAPTIDKHPPFKPAKIQDEEEEEPNPLVAQDEYMDDFPSPLATTKPTAAQTPSAKTDVKKSTSEDKTSQQKSPSSASRTKPANQATNSSVNPTISKVDKKPSKNTEIEVTKPGVMADEEFADYDKSPKITKKKPAPNTQKSRKIERTPPTSDQEDTPHINVAHETFAPEETDSKELDSFFDE